MAGCNIRRHKVLFEGTDEGTGNWIRLDSRYEDSPERVIQVYLEAGDTISLQGTIADSKNYNATEHSSFNEDTDVIEINEFTESGTGVIQGSYSYIRAVKTGSAGNAKVQGSV